MKKLLNLILFVALINAAAAQKVVNDTHAEKRNVSGYHAVVVSGGIDLYLSAGEESVAVSASENKFRDRIKTEVEDGVLKIYYERNDNKNFHMDVEWGNRKMKAYVSYKTLSMITASGGSDVNVDGSIQSNDFSLHLSGGCDFEGKINADDLKVHASGGSDVHISGNVKRLDVDASGGSDFNGYGLITDICTLDASGGSDVHITVNQELSADASGGSDIYYKGNGVIRDLKSSGSSSVKKESK
jgi:hypothetical protein